MRSTELPNFRTMTSAGHTAAGDTWSAFVFLSTIEPRGSKRRVAARGPAGTKKPARPKAVQVTRIRFSQYFYVAPCNRNNSARGVIVGEFPRRCIKKILCKDISTFRSQTLLSLHVSHAQPDIGSVSAAL